MVWSEGDVSLKNPVTPPGIDPGTIQLVAQRLNDYATPGPFSEHVMTAILHQKNNLDDTITPPAISPPP